MALTHSPFVFTPAMKLVLVLTMGVALQSGPGLWLALIAFGYVAVKHRARLIKLLRRVRLLILVLFAVTLFMTPGSALFPEWGLYPTVEGLSLALTQLLRLLGMLAVVAWLLDTTDDQSLAAGALALLSPLAGQRQWPERAVARLLLVFHYLEAAPKPRNLHDVLALARQDEIDPLPGAPTWITLDSAEMTTRDIWFALGALVLAGFCLVIGGSV